MNSGFCFYEYAIQGKRFQGGILEGQYFYDYLLLT